MIFAMVDDKQSYELNPASRSALRSNPFMGRREKKSMQLGNLIFNLMINYCKNISLGS